jgi:hypothetical protein
MAGPQCSVKPCRFKRNIGHGRSIVTRTENVSKSCRFGVILTVSMATIVALLPALAILTTAEASEDRWPHKGRRRPPGTLSDLSKRNINPPGQRGTPKALELFIARHPDSPLAQKARADLQRISR